MDDKATGNKIVFAGGVQVIDWLHPFRLGNRQHHRLVRAANVAPCQFVTFTQMPRANPAATC